MEKSAEKRISRIYDKDSAKSVLPLNIRFYSKSKREKKKQVPGKGSKAAQFITNRQFCSIVDEFEKIGDVRAAFISHLLYGCDRYRYDYT